MPEKSKSTQRTLGYTFLILAGLCFAIYIEIARALDRDLDWQAAALARGFFGLLTCIPLAWTVRSKLDCFNLKLLLRSGLICCFTFGILYSASQIAPADVLTITSTQPIWIALIAIILFTAKYTYRFWIACIIVVAGMILLVTAKPPDSYTVILLLFLITILRSFAIILLQSMKNIPPPIIALHFSIFLTLVAFIVFLFKGGYSQYEVMLNTKGIFLLIGIGLTANLFIIFSVKVVHILGSISCGVIGLVAAVIAYLIDIFLWNDPVSKLHILGLFLVLIPVAWIVLSKHVEKK